MKDSQKWEKLTKRDLGECIKATLQLKNHWKKILKTISSRKLILLVNNWILTGGPGGPGSPGGPCVEKIINDYGNTQYMAINGIGSV